MNIDWQKFIIDYLSDLSDEQRLEFFGTLQDTFCIHCGGIQFGYHCQCCNDK